MSNQPSTVDNIRATAASATQTVAETLTPSQNPSSDNTPSSTKKDPQDSTSDKSYKQQLDEAAYSHPTQGDEKKNESLVEKVISYIPGMSSLHKSQPEPNSEEVKKDGDPNSQTMPKRPEHDLQVEEFLKEQYKSKSRADMPNVQEGK